MISIPNNSILFVFVENDTTCPEDDVKQCFGMKCLPGDDYSCNKTLGCYGYMKEFYCCDNTSECGIQDVAVNCHDVPVTSSADCWLHVKYTDNNDEEQQINLSDIEENQVFTHFVGPRIYTYSNHTKSLYIQGISSLYRNMFTEFQWLTSITIRKTRLKEIIGHLFEGIENLLSTEITENPLLFSIHADAFIGLRNLTLLNLSYNSITDLSDGTFSDLSSLQVIDLRGQSNLIHITSNFFEKNYMLTHIYADSYAFCCFKPQLVTSENCVTPPKNAVTSCDDLIEDRILQTFLWIIGIMAVVGNLVVIVYHFVGNDPSRNETFSFFVTNLSISDAMMGTYMVIIGIHDVKFHNTYVYNEYEWKKSLLCKITGAMSYVSSESSVIFIFFITLDRFIAIKYPFGGWKITIRRAYVIAFFAWLISFFSAALPGKLYKGFYSRSGVCIALPLTGRTDEGRFYYSAAVFLGFNFLAFVLIAVGQYLIFREIKISSKRVRKSLSGREKSVAKLLLLIVVTDCLCWLPIGILGEMILL